MLFFYVNWIDIQEVTAILVRDEVMKEKCKNLQNSKKSAHTKMAATPRRFIRFAWKNWQSKAIYCTFWSYSINLRLICKPLGIKFQVMKKNCKNLQNSKKSAQTKMAVTSKRFTWFDWKNLLSKAIHCIFWSYSISLRLICNRSGTKTWVIEEKLEN